MKKIKFLLVIAILTISSCQTQDDIFLNEKENFINSKETILSKYSEKQEFIKTLEFNSDGYITSFKYTKIKNYMNDKEFKTFLVDINKSENVSEIIFVDSNGKQEVLFKNSIKNPNYLREKVYLFNNKKNHRRGGCKPRTEWICEIRVNESDTILV